MKRGFSGRKDWLGHRSISSTMIYAQVTNSDGDETYQRVRSSKEIARTDGD